MPGPTLLRYFRRRMYEALQLGSVPIYIWEYAHLNAQGKMAGVRHMWTYDFCHRYIAQRLRNQRAHPSHTRSWTTCITLSDARGDGGCSRGAAVHCGPRQCMSARRRALPAVPADPITNTRQNLISWKD